MAYPAGYLAGGVYYPLADEPVWARITVRLLLGLAAWTLAVALAAVVGLPLTSTVVRAYAAVNLLAATAVHFLRRDKGTRPGFGGHEWAVLAVVLATAALRLWQVRSVVWPLWGDAVNHTAVVSLFLQQQGLPSDWGAYIPTSTTFSYHFGFHAWAAAISWLTDVPAWWAVFWTERFLSALAPLGVYLLTLTFFGDRRAALGAALAVGLWTKMPQYYVNWSRDTQLLGQTLLPLVSYLLVGAAQRRRRAAAGVLGALSLTAMVFAHYLVYMLALGLVVATVALLYQRRHRLAALLAPGIVALAGALVAAPWVWRVLQTQQAVWRSAHVTYSADFGRLFFEAPPILEYETLPVLLLGVAGAVTGLRRHARPTLALLIWLGCMLLTANGYRTPIRALHQVNYIAVYMALYLITGPFIGVFLAEAAGFLHARVRVSPKALAAAAVVAGSAAGLLSYGNIINELYVLVRAEDVRAFAWIEQNTDPEASFLINSFSATGQDGLVVGSDAGWWLTIATARQVTVPVINYQTELVTAGYVSRMRSLSALDTATLLTDQGVAQLCREGVTYVYVGAVGGPLDGMALAQSPLYRPVYEDGAARVLAIDCAR